MYERRGEAASNRNNFHESHFCLLRRWNGNTAVGIEIASLRIVDGDFTIFVHHKSCSQIYTSLSLRLPASISELIFFGRLLSLHQSTSARRRIWHTNWAMQTRRECPSKRKNFLLHADSAGEGLRDAVLKIISRPPRTISNTHQTLNAERNYFFVRLTSSSAPFFYIYVAELHRLDVI